MINFKRIKVMNIRPYVHYCSDLSKGLSAHIMKNLEKYLTLHNNKNNK